MSHSNPTTKVSLKDRIAAIEKRNAASAPSTNAGSSLSPSLPNQTGLRDRIANFELKGPVPAPRGSFGMGAPPLEAAQLRKRSELYGNRIPSVPGVQPGARLVMSHTGTAVPSTSVPPFMSKANRRFSASIEFNNLPKFDPTMGPSPGHSGQSTPAVRPSSPSEAASPGNEAKEAVISGAPFPHVGSPESDVPSLVTSPPIIVFPADPPEPTREISESPAPVETETGVADSQIQSPTVTAEHGVPSALVLDRTKPVAEETASTAAKGSRELAPSRDASSSSETVGKDARLAEPAPISSVPTPARDDDGRDSVSSPPSDVQVDSSTYDNVLEVPPLTPSSSSMTLSPMSTMSFNPVAAVESTVERFAQNTGRGVPVFLAGTRRAKSDFFTPESVDISAPPPHQQTRIHVPSTTAVSPAEEPSAPMNKPRIKANTYSVVVNRKSRHDAHAPAELKSLSATPFKHAGLPAKPETPMSPGFQDLALLMEDTSRLEQLLSGGFSDNLQLQPLALPDDKEEVVSFEGPQPASLDIASLAARPIKKKRSLKNAPGHSKSSSSQSTVTGIPPPVPPISDKDLTKTSNGAHQRSSTTSELQRNTSEFSDSSEVAPTPPPKSKKYFSSLRRLGSSARPSSKHTSVSSSSVEESPQLLTPSDDTSEFGMRPSRPSSVYGFPSSASWSSLSPKKSSKSSGMLRTTSLADKWNRARKGSNVSSLDVPSDVSQENGRLSIALPALTLLPPLESVTPRSSSEFADQQQHLHGDVLSNPPPRVSSLQKAPADSVPDFRRSSFMSDDTSFSSSIAPTPIDTSFFDSFPAVPQTTQHSRLSTADRNLL